MLLRFQKAAVRKNYETGNQAFSICLRFLTRGERKTRSVFIRYAIVATKNIQNAMNALEKNDGTLMEPDAKLAQRLVTGFRNSFVFIVLEPRARVELATCRLRIGCSTTELPRPFIIKDLFRCLAP